jgi:hypothetical protein
MRGGHSKQACACDRKTPGKIGSKRKVVLAGDGGSVMCEAMVEMPTHLEHCLLYGSKRIFNDPGSHRNPEETAA